MILGILIEYAGRDMTPNCFEGNYRFSLEHLKQEYPSYGSGDMRYPAFELEQKNGSRTVDFQYKEHVIFAGKKKLKRLTAVYRKQIQKQQHLKWYWKHKLLKTKIILSYTI